MTQTHKLVLLTALGLAGVAGTIHAQSYSTGDLLVGIYEPSANNTLVYDLGSAAAITGQSFEQWNLAAYLTAAGITLTGQTQYGVVGASGAVNPATAYATGIGSATWTGGDVASINSAVGTIGQYLSGGYVAEPISGGNGSDWFNETIVTPPQNNTLISTVIGNSLNSPLGTAEVLYASTGSYVAGRPPTANPGSEVTELAFDLNGAGELTYGTPVPEPSTEALLAGAGVLLIALRKQLIRKHA